MVKELEDEYEISRLYIFGDFSKYNIGMDLERLKSLTKNVIHTASEKDGVDKDFTDVIMLDAIYRSVADKENEEVYVLFTGDAHFTKVVQYLKELGKKGSYLWCEIRIQQQVEIRGNQLCGDAKTVTGKESL